MAVDPSPEMIPAGTVIVPSHVDRSGTVQKWTTLPGQRRIELSVEEQTKIAEPRLAGFNKSPYMGEVLGGPIAKRHAKHGDGRVHQFPIITTEGMIGQWKPWSICNDAPEFMHTQSGDPLSILKKIKRDKRIKQPTERIGFHGHVNPWSVSQESPAWIEGHMKQYDEHSILTRNVKKAERARRQFENSDVRKASTLITGLLKGATYHLNDNNNRDVPYS